MKNKNWTPVDAFVTEYGFRNDATFTYQPGSGEATFESKYGLDLDDLRALIKAIEHHELQISVDGKILVYKPEEHGEAPMKTEDEETPIGKCPECGAPATHPSGLCRDCHQAKLEDEDIPEEIAEAIENVETLETEPEIAEAIEEEELIQERVT